MIWFLDKLRQKEERELAAIEAQPQLFEEDEFSRQKTFDLKAPILEKIEIINDQQKDVDKITAPFNWGLDFFEIIELRGGFDIVIANPPYGVKVDTTVRDEFGVQSKDSYGVFTVLGLRILRPGGTLCYIMSDTWQTIRSHKKLRNTLLKETDTQYLISVPPDVFAATVNTGVYSFMKRLAPREKYGRDADNWILAADFSPLKIRQENGQLDSGDLEAAFELLIEELDGLDETKDGYTITSGRDFAIFAYRQKLIPRFSNHSFFIASPKLFGLMRDVGNIKNQIEAARGEIPIYSLDFNGKELELVKLGDVAKVVVGLQTGDNYYYLRQSKESIRGASRNYRVVNWNLVLTDQDLQKIANNEKLRLEVIEKGISLDPQSNRYFGERYFVPYDKGGASEIEEGWLPNYFVSTDYFIDYSEKAANCLINNIPIRRSSGETYPRNKQQYFKQGISFSDSGVYSPTYRVSNSHLFDQKGSLIIPNNQHNNLEYLALITSKVGLFILKNFCNHSISSHVDSIKMNLIPNLNSNVSGLVSSIIIKQKSNPRYDYMTNEQVEIDRLVYQMYNLNEEDIKEVEDWYFRRYPKLARVIEDKLEYKEKNNDR